MFLCLLFPQSDRTGVEASRPPLSLEARMNRASDQTGGLTSDALVPSSWVESLPAFSQIQSAQED